MKEIKMTRNQSSIISSYFYFIKCLFWGF